MTTRYLNDIRRNWYKFDRRYVKGPERRFKNNDGQDDRWPVGIHVRRSYGVKVRKSMVHGASIGLLTDSGVNRLEVDDLTIAHTTGQHGAYIQQITDSVLRGVTINGARRQGFKMQLHKGNRKDSSFNLIEDLTVVNAISHALLITRTGGTQRIRDTVFRRVVLHVHPTRGDGSALTVIGPHEVWLEDVTIINSAAKPIRIEGGAKVHGLSKIKILDS